MKCAILARARTWEACRSMDARERLALYEQQIDRNDPHMLEREARGVVVKRAVLERMDSIPRHRALVEVDSGPD